MDDRKIYKRIVKGTAAFGGVQFFQVAITVIRGKITALLIGAQGYGISSLYTSSLAIIITMTGLGCTMGAVKYIAEQSDRRYCSYRIRLVERVFVGISFAGMMATVLLSYNLSFITFSSYEYMFSYCILSIYVFTSLYNSGGFAIFQGMQDLKSIMYGNIIPSFIGLFVSLPLYYIWGLEAIVPVILVVPILSAVYIKAVLIKKYSKNDQEIIEGYEVRKTFKELCKTGITTMIPNLSTSICVLGLNAYISHMGNIVDIGLYNAGTNITNQYTGLIFSAMAMDYLPRLIKVINNERETNEIVNKQAEIVVIFALPLLALMMMSAPAIIVLLLSDEFCVLKDFIRIIAFGIIMKAMAWCLSYMAFAKGDRKIFLLMELMSNFVLLIMNMIGYYGCGLDGLAISYWFFYLVYLISYCFLVSVRYGFVISIEIKKIFGLSILSLSILYAILKVNDIIAVYISVIWVSIICFVCFRMLNNRIGIGNILK